ncbi:MULTISPECIES: CBS domain-containing protein [unclassified Shinella]|jgi:CBS domain-containing protein|uniref:CBS domain-containing protein n=1 Tax=unclassified Shinella TaxID=2643062 RepID=UPI0003C54298|nr:MULTISPECIES: CBS domain-containing protein [unclassified Shinella]EYR84666.1 inosine-5'-monophosphate dehydrogenase-like protein [Shinella sp. DD12]MCA0345043.1 CBS domain-containing protein [Pseudomonadota bacterium]TAA52796.1 CBS domain-containing protein [Shinella sp. JR1-6]
MLVKDVMSAQMVTVSPNDTAQSAARLMLEAEVGALPVEVPGVGAIVGIITDRDIVISVLGRGHSTSMAIAEFMTVSPEVCDESDDTATVALRMRGLGVRRLVVVNGGRRVVGIVSLVDIPTEGPAAEESQ